MNHQKLMSMKVKPWFFLLLLTPLPYLYISVRDIFDDQADSYGAGALALILLPWAFFMGLMNFSVIDYSVKTIKTQTTYQQVIK